MADFDEELRRQAAISSLLAQQPESQPLDTQTDEQVVAQPEVIKPDTQADYHKLINQAFDTAKPSSFETKTDEQVVAQPDPTVYPTIAQDQPAGLPKNYPNISPPAPEPADVQTDPETGTRYVQDPLEGKIPHAEIATEADKEAFKPSDVTLPEETAIGTGAPIEVRRGERVLEVPKPTPESSLPEPVPGFVTDSKNAILNPAAGVIPPKAAPRAEIVQDPIVTRSIATNIAAQNAPAPAAPATPAPAPAPAPTDQTQVTQPDSNDDYNKLMDSVFPSVKPADTSLAPLTGEFQPDTSGSTRLNARTNNPGALGIAKWEEKYGVTSSGVTDTGHFVAQFPTKEAGAAAQFDLWRRSGQFNGQTLRNAITNWIGPGEHGEAEYISQATGIPLNQVIDEDFLKSPAGIRLMQAQAHYEGANVLTAEQWKRGQDWAYGGVAPTGETSTTAQNKMPWDDWAKLSPADQAAAEKEGQDFRTQQTSVLDKLNQSTPNPKQFWDILQNPIEGVTDAQRQAYAENWKKQATQSAVDFYSQKGTVAEQHVDPEEAFKKAVSDPGFEAYVGNVGRGLAGAVGQADIGIALAGKSIDRNRVDGFMNLVHPDSTGEGRAGFVKALTDIQDTRQRHLVFNQLYGDLPQNTKDAIGDPASILDSIDHLADPAKQAQLNKAIATKKAWVDQQLAGDPQLRGTGADWWTTGTGENLFNTVASLIPGGVGAVIRTSTLGSQIYSSNLDKIAKENPSLTPEQVSEEASKSAFMTLAPQEAVMALSHGIAAPILKWVGSLAEKPIVRFGIGGGVQVGAAAVGGAAGQVGENIAENKPLLTNVPQAAGAAVVQSLPFAVHGGLGALGHEVTPAEHVAPPLPVSSIERPTSEYVPPEPTLGEHGPPPDQPGTFEAPISGEQHGSAFGQLYPDKPVEGDEHGPAAFAREGAFTPAELQAKVAELFQDNSYSPEELRAKVEQLQPDPVLQPEIARGLAPAPEPVTLPEAIRKAKANAVAASLGGVPDETARSARSEQPPERPPPIPTRVSESEPFTSKIANRYTTERMAAGELGHIDPSQGKSTEELVKQGMQMAPDQRERLINNFTRGVGGDLDNQGAAIRSKEAMLSVQSTEAGRASEADPTNLALKANADAALKAATDFHNGPVKKFKRVWSNSGRGLQREIPLDFTTLNGMREAYMKGQGNGKAAPSEMEPALKETAARVKKSASDEEAAINQWGKDVEKQTRGKTVPSDDNIRAKLMKIMNDLPCRN